MSEYAVSALLTLFVVVDPIAMAPTFLVVTEGMPRASRQSVAVRASIIAGVILIGTALIGDWLLDTLEISLSAFRSPADCCCSGSPPRWFRVRSQHEGEAAEQAFEERVRNVAAFPLAIPLLAGPGPSPPLAARHPRRRQYDVDWNSYWRRAAYRAVLLDSFVSAERISGLLGKTGNLVLSRLLGVLLAALAVQYVVDGIRSVLAGER